MSENQSQTPDENMLVPSEPLRGVMFARVGWAIVRSRWQVLAPTVAVVALAIAAVDIAMSVWVFGSVSAAAQNSFDPTSTLLLWATKPNEALGVSATRIGIAVVVTGLLLPLMSTVTAGAVVADAQRNARLSAGHYVVRGLAATPASIAATLMSAVIAAAPIAAVVVVIGRSGSSAAQSAGLLFLGTPALLWLAFAAIRLSLAPQAVAIERCGAVAALRASWKVTRGSAMRIAGITIVTGLVASVLSALLAAPVAALGTLTALGQTEANSGKLASEHFLTTAVSGFIATGITAVIAALLFLDAKRRQAPPALPPIA